MKNILYILIAFLVITNLQAQTPTIGDIRHGFDIADGAGWILLNGRLKSALTATQQVAATSVGIGANLPNATGKVLMQKALLTTGGGSVTLTQANLPNIAYNNVTTVSSGAHTHGIAWSGTPIGGPPAANTGGLANGGAFSPLGYFMFNAPSTTGAHSHPTVTVTTGGSGTAITTTPANIGAKTFIYLGL
jgi:hypothetical protein